MKNKTQRIIKKYHNRRLYDISTSSYVVINDIKAMIMADDDVIVIDAKDGTDITRSVLLQIISSEESNVQQIFSNKILLQLIKFCGKSLQSTASVFIEQSIKMMEESQACFLSQLETSNASVNKPVDIELWQKYIQENAPKMQNALIDCISASAENFVKLQFDVQKQIQTQGEEFISFINSILKKY